MPRITALPLRLVFPLPLNPRPQVQVSSYWLILLLPFLFSLGCDVCSEVPFTSFPPLLSPFMEGHSVFSHFIYCFAFFMSSSVILDHHVPPPFHFCVQNCFFSCKHLFVSTSFPSFLVMLTLWRAGIIHIPGCCLAYIAHWELYLFSCGTAQHKASLVVISYMFWLTCSPGFPEVLTHAHQRSHFLAIMLAYLLVVPILDAPLYCDASMPHSWYNWKLFVVLVSHREARVMLHACGGTRDWPCTHVFA